MTLGPGSEGDLFDPAVPVARIGGPGDHPATSELLDLGPAGVGVRIGRPAIRNPSSIGVGWTGAASQSRIRGTGVQTSACDPARSGSFGGNELHGRQVFP